ncbi:MAG TPA: SLBB domain-containing protein, partial [Pyrinomonadaceae bacterium]|nr:SLBB domain-containing protein [Pyrinomonadaceae bacterium]
WRPNQQVSRVNRLVLWIFSICCLFTLQSAIYSQTPSPTPISEEDLAHFGDVIDVDILGGFDFDWRGTLTPDGYLNGVGFNEPIYGLCRSEAEIAASAVKAFSKILRDPKVVVRIVDRSNRAVVRLEGAVKTPTRFRIKRPIRLTELLVLAGGLTDDVSGDISIFRPRDLNCRPSSPQATNNSDKSSSLPSDNRSETITIKISDLLIGSTAANIQILSGDMIDVQRAVPVYVIGAVNSPRPVYSRANITVSRAIASAGGLAKGADPTKISIFRRDGTESRSIDVDYDKIKRGVTDDIVLSSFDIIDVASKGGGKRKYPPELANSAKNGRNGKELPLRVID